MKFLTELKRHHNEPKSPSEYVAYGMWLLNHAQEIINLVEAAEEARGAMLYRDNFSEAVPRLTEALAALNKDQS